MSISCLPPLKDLYRSSIFPSPSAFECYISTISCKANSYYTASSTSHGTRRSHCCEGEFASLFGTGQFPFHCNFFLQKLTSPLNQGIMWGGTALSLCFLIFRMFVRLRYFKKVYADDFFVLAAWLMLLTSSIIWQMQQTPLYYSFKLSAGQMQATANVLAAEQSFFHANLAVLILFLSCLWSVKISVLVFFRRLGQQVRGQKIWWWSVMGFTILTWAICIGVLQYWCLMGPTDYILSESTKPLGRYNNNPMELNAEHRISKALQETPSTTMLPQMFLPTP